MKSTFSSVVGTWLLHNYTTIRDGVPSLIPHWGSGINGVISYSQSGWVITSMASNDSSILPLDLAYPPTDNQSDAEWAMIGRSTLSYSGRYTVYPSTHSTGRIEHGPLTGASVPTLIGSLLRRNYTIVKSNDQVFVELSFITGQSEQVLWWRRLD
ncbi:Lipocalin-like domain-containing protein [Madurella fahalii]|uniref:Lipocalin-like domain-containing protein n=1 Tax=Madurella fahalii TaxID=1157608 RepID=A0ABQ0GJG7_9PEZI